MKTRTASPTTRTLAHAAALLLGASALQASAATFITSDMTVAGGNPISGNYSGSPVLVGVNSGFIPILNVKVDVLASAVLNYSDQTGGGLGAYSNSVVNVYGGSFGQFSPTGCCGGLAARDTSRVSVSGGALDGLSVSGSAPGAGGARIDFSGGVVQNYRAIVAGVQNGVLNVSGGTIRSTSGQPALVGNPGSIINLRAGLVQSDGGTAVALAGDSALTMTGGTVTALSAAGSGVVTSNVTTAAQLRGGTVNGGVRSERIFAWTPAVQAVLGGTVTVNGGVFATQDAAIEIDGGTYGIYGGGSGAHFVALGSNMLNFVGNGLTVSGPVAGSLFFTNTFLGNFYTFTGGAFADGQSAAGLRVFDAVSLGGSTTGLQGGLAISAVPEPTALALMLMGFPLLAGALRRRSRD